MLRPVTRLDLLYVRYLTSGQHFDGDDLLDVAHDLEAFACRKAAHGDVVLRAGAGGEGVHAGGVAEGLVLGDEGGGRAVGQHEAGVEAAVLHQEGRQLAVRRVHCRQKDAELKGIVA